MIEADRCPPTPSRQSTARNSKPSSPRGSPTRLSPNSQPSSLQGSPSRLSNLKGRMMSKFSLPSSLPPYLPLSLSLSLSLQYNKLAHSGQRCEYAHCTSQFHLFCLYSFFSPRLTRKCRKYGTGLRKDEQDSQ